MDHPDFLGSKSLKAVLPVVCPDLTYEGMPVADGTMAQVAWNEYIDCLRGERRDELEYQLLQYCKLDTWAMVQLYGSLRDLTRGGAISDLPEGSGAQSGWMFCHYLSKEP